MWFLSTYFYHNLGRGRKAILYGSLLGQFYLPPSNKKDLKVFKNVYNWVDIMLLLFLQNIPYIDHLSSFVFFGKSSTTR